jgi:hypothetical protein
MPEGKAVEKGEVIETTVSEAAAELARHGLDAHDRITITIEPDELIPVRFRNWLSEILAAAPKRNTGGGGRSPAFRDRLGAVEDFPGCAISSPHRTQDMDQGGGVAARPLQHGSGAGGR